MLTGASPYTINISIDYPFWQKTWFIVMLILLVPMLVYGIIRRRTKSLLRMNQRLHVMVKEKTFLLEAEKESVARINVQLEQKSKDITDSIRYAKRIQLAILTDMEIFQRNFPDSFVFYQPRDIVSGDFYWFAERDNLFFIAIADCTGHGVPGAFMSMISSTLINKVVFDQGHTLPSEILKSLNNEIKISLHQQESSESSHDGLDVALCVVDQKANVLRFSGAGRPLLHVRDGEVNVYKTHKGGLGGVYTKTTPVFDEVAVDLQRGDCFYMYSDGFTDQFGGARQQKFSSPNLRGLLKMISSLPMKEQGESIKDAFNTWKGSEEQCDDVLIAGFRI
jgi:serine phosphatase RsbU (regulator of sigma subunit)